MTCFHLVILEVMNKVWIIAWDILSLCLNNEFYPEIDSRHVPLWIEIPCILCIAYSFMLPSCILHCIIGIKPHKCRNHIPSSNHSFYYWFREVNFPMSIFYLTESCRLSQENLLSCLGDIQMQEQRKYLSAIQKIIQILCCTQKHWK